VGASALEQPLPDGLYAEIATPKGVVTCRLEYEKAPMTVMNFVGLAEGSLGPEPRRPFFDGLTFHRVVQGFVVQGGDPLGTGEGGPGYTFPDEFVQSLRHDSAGVLSMANEGPDTNGSQFFITLAPADRLDFLHSVFGRAVRGAEVLSRISQGDSMRVRIIRIGRGARAFKADRGAFGALAARAARYSAQRVPGPSAHFDDPGNLLPADPPRAASFNFKLANVERATGLRIYARVFGAFAPGPAAGTREDFARGLARSLGIEEDGVLAVYFADTGAWSLAVGRTVARRFMHLPDDPGGNYGGDTLARATRNFLVESGKREQRYLAKQPGLLTNNLQTAGQKMKTSVDALLDELLTQLLPD
jgi:cyclophilin family peptidyl-prolyl cis-trans isomerase